MKNNSFLISSMFLALLIFSSCPEQDVFPVLKGPYLGQEPPGMTAELFDPGIFFEGEIQGCSGFLNDGTVFVFTSQKPESDWRLRPTFVTELKDGRWTKPQIASFSKYAPYNFTVGPDGQTIYFTTLKSPDLTTRIFMEEANIWAVKLEIDGWAEPVMFGRSINTEQYYENYPSVTSGRTIYYMSRREVGIGGGDVWRSIDIDGRYAKAENVGAPVNTEDGDIDPFVAPDESYLIVCQEKEGGIGRLDLYVYFKKQNGGWTESINMGANVNSADSEARPYVTPDGKYLFFTSNRPNPRKTGNIYWVDVKIIEQLKPASLK